MTHSIAISLGQASLEATDDGRIGPPNQQPGWPTVAVARCQFSGQVEAAAQLLARGELAESAAQFRVLLQIGLTEADAELTEAACHNLAAVYRQSKQWDTGAIWQQQSLSWRMQQAAKSLPQSADELGRLACDLTGCGCDAFLKQDWQLAESLWRRALAIEEWRGSWEGQATDSGNLGLLAAAQGRLVDGIRWLKQSLQLHRLMLDACGEGTDLMNLAELQRLQGKLPHAIRLLGEAIRCFERAEALPLRDLAVLRLREVHRFVEIEKLDPQLN